MPALQARTGKGPGRPGKRGDTMINGWLTMPARTYHSLIRGVGGHGIGAAATQRR
jgi:hypothetical protein